MDFLDIQFSNIELFGFAIMALLLFFLLKLAEKGLPFLIKNHDNKLKFSRYYNIIEIFVWLGFIIYIIQKLSDSNQIYALGLFALFMVVSFWLLWYYVRSYINGSIFKLNRKFEINDTVQINEYQGKIIEMGKHRLELESDSGEVIYIPYSQLNNAVIVKLHPGEMVLSHSFTISALNNQKVELKQQAIRFDILSLPWSSIKKEPLVKLIHEDKNHLVFEVVIYTLEKEYFFKMEQEIRNKYDISE